MMPSLGCACIGLAVWGLAGCELAICPADKEYQEGLPPSKKLKANIGDLYLSNQISAQRAQEIFEDIKDAGAGSADMKKLSKGLDSDTAQKLGKNPNASRDLGRRLLKRCPWPELY